MLKVNLFKTLYKNHMNLFKKYEELKKTGKLLPIGSIWEDAYGTVVITVVKKYYIYYECLTFNSEDDADEFLESGSISKDRFLKLFSRVK